MRNMQKKSALKVEKKYIIKHLISSLGCIGNIDKYMPFKFKRFWLNRSEKKSA